MVSVAQSTVSAISPKKDCPQMLSRLLLVTAVAALAAAGRVYNTKAGPVPDKVNVHIVPHT